MQHPHKASGGSRGSKVFDIKLLLLDEHDNKLDAAQGEVWPLAVVPDMLCRPRLVFTRVTLNP
jgi:hypothetical protein